MKKIFSMLFFVHAFCCIHAQLLGTFSSWTDPNHHDCIFQHNPISISTVDAIHKQVKKTAVKDLTECIRACNKYFSYNGIYADSTFQFIVPVYLDSQTFALGANNFRIYFESRDSSHSDIVVNYDFLNEERKDYNIRWARDNDGQIKRSEAAGKTVFFSTNWTRRWEGILFLDNNISICYRTDDKTREEDLLRCITSFKWSSQ